MLKQLFSGIALSLMMTAPTYAAAPQTSLDPAAIAAAHNLLDTMDMKATMEGLIDSLIAIQVQQIKAANPNVKDDAIQMYAVAFREEFVAREGHLMDVYADLYAEHFSAAELQEVSAFYHTPTGKKLLTELPGIMKEVQPVAISFGQDIAKSVHDRLEVDLQKRGEKL